MSSLRERAGFREPYGEAAFSKTIREADHGEVAEWSKALVSKTSVPQGTVSSNLTLSAMTKYVALLRGIGPTNPNMRNEKLRGVFEELGFRNVQTLISSGNVLFESASKNPQMLEAKIEKALPRYLGFSSTTIIRSHAELTQLAARNPFKGAEHGAKSYLVVTFLKNKTTAKIEFPHRPQNKTYELLMMHDRAICSVIDLSGAKTPDLMTWLEKRFGKEITTRTWKTVSRILKKMGGADA